MTGDIRGRLAHSCTFIDLDVSKQTNLKQYHINSCLFFLCLRIFVVHFCLHWTVNSVEADRREGKMKVSQGPPALECRMLQWCDMHSRSAPYINSC